MTKAEEYFLTLSKEIPDVKDGKMLRFESFLRNVNNLVLYKGSFNPPHIAHQEIAMKAKEIYGVETLFCISTKTYEKNDIDVNDLCDLIDILNRLGYSVIISKKPFSSFVFYWNLKSFR